MVALLNEKTEAEVCDDIIMTISDQIDRLERELTTSVLDRDAYLQKIGSVNLLRQVRDKQRRIYEAAFNV